MNYKVVETRHLRKTRALESTGKITAIEAAERRKNAAHGASRGFKRPNKGAQKGRKRLC